MSSTNVAKPLINPDDLDTVDKFRDHEEVIAAPKETLERQKTEPAMALTLRNVWFNLNSLRILVTALFVRLGATNLSVACILGVWCLPSP